MSTPLAASLLSKVGDLIDKFGAYAGFAAVIGLALLTLLYIAQARELKRLREWAGQMPERVGDLQGRLAGPAGPANVPAPTSPAPPLARPEPAQPPAVATAAQATAAIATPAAAAAAQATAATKAAPDAAVKPGEAPLLTPGETGADGARVAAGQPTQALPATAPVNPLERARRPQTARAAGVPPTGAPRPRGPVIAASLAALAALAAVGYLLFGNSDGGGGAKVTTTATKAADTTAKTTERKTQPTGAQLNGQTKIFVLNGTTTTGLAQRVEAELTKKGFKALGRDTATDQTRAATAVMFSPGKRADALRVANALGKGAEVVQPVDPGSAAQAKRPDGTVPDVVVLVGSDENTPG